MTTDETRETDTDTDTDDRQELAGPDVVPDTAQKDPETWVTGDEPMTGPQHSYLQTLAHEAGEEPPPADLSKAEASKRIDDLQERTGRG